MHTQCILSYLNALLIYGSVSTDGNYHSNRRLVLCLVVKHSVVWATKLHFGMDVQQNKIWETLGAHYLEYRYHSIMFVISCGARPLPKVLQCHCVSFLHKSEQSLPPVGLAQESSPTLLHTPTLMEDYQCGRGRERK